MVVRIWARRWGALQSPSVKPVQAGTSSCDAKTTAATADDASPGPSITSWPRLADLERYYPPDPDRQGIAGMVLIEVTLDRHGRPTEALVLGEEPLDMGFGAAASALAHVMVYSNPTGQVVQLKFKVKFAPGREHARPQPVTDVPAEPPQRRV